MAAINVETYDLRPVQQVIFARIGKRVAPATLWRWRLHGIGGAKLECVRVGGIWCTTAEAFGRFIREQTEARAPDVPATEPAERSPCTQRRLAAAGLT